MGDNWNLASVEQLDDSNYFLWSEKIEGILRSKKLWKKVINVKPPEKPEEEDDDYEVKNKAWNEWDDDNYAARTVMINTMSKAQLLKYSREKRADKLWSLIKHEMADETEQLRARSLSELSNIRMKKGESVDNFLNRAEALRNQCVQLGRRIEDYEIKMYVLRGLRVEFEQNIRVFETQKELTINDIRYALKQEEIRRENKKEEKTSKDYENVKKVRDKAKNDTLCYNCGMKGHMSHECYNKQKCFNCQGYNHIAADCKEPKRYPTSQGRGYRGTSRGRGTGRGRGRNESTLKVSDEAVLTVSDEPNVSTMLTAKENNNILEKDTEDCIWLLDSGATSHMSCDKKLFASIKKEVREIQLADKNGRNLTSEGIGEIPMEQSMCETKVRLENVLYVPDINANLLSVAKITDHGYKIKFDKDGAIVYDEKIIMRAERIGNAYYVEPTIANKEIATVSQDMDIWHRRLGHVSQKIVEEMKKEDLVIGMTKKERKQCESCVEGKMCRKNHPRLEGRKTKEIMELWHLDLIGPIKPQSRGEKRYALTVIDDYSRVIFVELLKEKSDTTEVLKQLIVLKENQTGKKLKALRSDNGGEFTGTYLNDWLNKKGIKHELSPPRTPQCNGVVERANKSIIEITRSMISDSKMPLDFWAEAIVTAVHVKNRVKSLVHGKTPYEMWNKRKPNIQYMRRFGCMAYLLDKEKIKKKFEPKTQKGIFVGYSANNMYRIYIPETGRIRNDCDVKFDESKNGYELLEEEKENNQTDNKNLVIIGLNSDNEDENNEQLQIDMRKENHEERESETENGKNEDAVLEEPNGEITMQDDIAEMPEIQERQLGETRIKGRPKGTTKDEMETRMQVQRQEDELRSREQNLRRSKRIKNQPAAMLSMDIKIPKNVRDVKESDNMEEWRHAMEKELASMKKHEVWDLVPRTREKKTIKSKWVFSIKEDPNTGQRRYKARLVALGCGQRPGVDYEETFAPVIRTETIRLLLSISAQKGRKIKMYDVETAFLHGRLKEEIFMELPEGYQGNKNQVCRLKRSIYGLKQAGRCWNEYLTEILKKCGLQQSKEDPCLFFILDGDNFLFCGIHVDDMPIISSNETFERKHIEKIRRHVNLKDLGEAKNILGMQVEQKGGKICVNQKFYIEKLLELYGMQDCNAVGSPIDPNTKLEEYEESGRCDATQYQELLGRLMYLSVYTRPDLSFALSCLSQFNYDPRVMHMTALKRMLRYLKGTINYCLEYGKKNPFDGIECETDASWDSTRDAKSFTGLLIYNNGDLIHWKSKKQSTVALSSTDSELEAMLEGLKEVIWTRRLIEETGLSRVKNIEVRCDNLNAVKLANGGNFKTKSKILNRKCYYIREHVMKEKINVKHVSSDMMTADCLTKPLTGPKLLMNVKKFMSNTSS